MKILIPTDFSKTAEKAFDAGILLAYKFDADIHILHCIEIPYFWKLTPKHVKLTDQICDALIEQAKEKLESYKKKLEAHNINCTYEIVSEKFIDVLSDISVTRDLDVMVIGSDGVSSKENRVMGSMTQKAIREFNGHSLIIKETIDTIDFKKVVYVSGLNKNEKADFEKFLSFISHFDIEELHILCIDTMSYFMQPTIVMEEALKDFKEIAKDYNTKTHFYKDYSISKGVKNFCKENNIDLIAMSNAHKNAMSRIIRGSNVETVVNHSDLPVFTIDY